MEVWESLWKKFLGEYVDEDGYECVPPEDRERILKSLTTKKGSNLVDYLDDTLYSIFYATKEVFEKIQREGFGLPGSEEVSWSDDEYRAKFGKGVYLSASPEYCALMSREPKENELTYIFSISKNKLNRDKVFLDITDDEWDVDQDEAWDLENMKVCPVFYAEIIPFRDVEVKGGIKGDGTEFLRKLGIVDY